MPLHGAAAGRRQCWIAQFRARNRLQPGVALKPTGAVSTPAPKPRLCAGKRQTSPAEGTQMIPSKSYPKWVPLHQTMVYLRIEDMPA
ncbi:hypothetical protein NRY95_05135 [Xanthomonas campestris pv. phormiicola]|nr:hypothetical protein [Xanthomonas campestris pv. phormiicola]UYC17350.1 hypothetical protein NRY95_05135 [Xanthomonas campestris pv. phormiicola]